MKIPIVLPDTSKSKRAQKSKAFLLHVLEVHLLGLENQSLTPPQRAIFVILIPKAPLVKRNQKKRTNLIRNTGRNPR